MALIDFAILTALPEDEFEAVREVFPDLDEVGEHADVWYRTRVAAKTGANYEVVAAVQTGIGPLPAHSLTARVIERWDPAAIIVIGIAGSFSDDVKLGDVMVSQQVFHYDPGKALDGGIQYRPEGYPCGVALIRQTVALRVDPHAFADWQNRAQDSATQIAEKIPDAPAGASEKKQALVVATRDSLRQHRPRIHFGTVASGELVITDKGKKRELLALHGKILGTEMEGAGVMHAAFYQREIPTPAIVMKGISDAADPNKRILDRTKFWRRLAAEDSARLALDLIRRGRIRPLLADQFSLDATSTSPAEVRHRIPDPAAPGVAFLGFPQLVVPKGPLTSLSIQVKVDGASGPINVAKLVIETADAEGKRTPRTFTTEELAGTPPAVQLRGPLAARPVGLYAMVLAKPVRAVFTVATPSTEQVIEWVPGSPGV